MGGHLRKCCKGRYPHGLNDCFDTLIYAKTNAAELGIRDDRFITAGHSGSGGMTAALTMKTLDAQAAEIAFQMPIYPMIDHRMQTTSAMEMVGTAIWDRRSNALAWDNYPGNLKGNVPDHAFPSLREDLKAHVWFERIKAGETFTEIAKTEETSKRRIQQIIDLAYLAPDVIRDVLQGKQPIGFTSDWCLRHGLPSGWNDQRRLIALL